MQQIAAFLLAATLAFACHRSVQVAPPTSEQAPTTMSFHALSALDIHGENVPMDRYKGLKVIVVNTASECGYTPQYKQLQELYSNYKDKGLVIIGFPCNDFGAQEPGTEAEIAQFCEKNFGVTFPLMSKVHVKGAEQHPVYQWLTSKAKNGAMDSEVKWNFHKYLIDEQGRLVKSLGSGVEPFDEEIINWLN